MNVDGSDTPSLHNQSKISNSQRKQFLTTRSITSQTRTEFAIDEMTSGNINDKVLDLACGSGIVSCAFAKVTNHVTGIDLTPAMLAQAKKASKTKRPLE